MIAGVTRLYRRISGDWAPGNFDPWVTLAAKVVLYIVMAVWGADYLTAESTESLARLTVVEAALPLQVWGWAMVVSALLGFAGVAFAWAPAVAWAHVLGGALFLAIGTGTLITQLTTAGGVGPVMAVALSSIMLLTVFISYQLYQARPDQPRGWLGAFGFGLAVVLCITALEVNTFRSAVLGLSFGVLHLVMATGALIQDRRQTILRERGVTV